MELVFVRHGRVEGHPYNPPDNVSLSALGRRQAQYTAECLAAEAPYDALLCSPLARACQTAGIISERLGRAPQIIADLREITRSEVGRAVLYELLAGVGIETSLAAPITARIERTLNAIYADHSAHRVVVVSHGGFIWGTLRYLFPAQRSQFARRRPVANCALTRIDLRANHARLLSLNDIAHLRGEATA